jgi:hypothetical protein
MQEEHKEDRSTNGLTIEETIKKLEEKINGMVK